MNRKKYVFHWEKWNFELIVNFVNNTQFLVLGKALNIYIEYLMFYLNRHGKLKHILVQVYIQQCFHDE